jgi:hypothetical protein
VSLPYRSSSSDISLSLELTVEPSIIVCSAGLEGIDSVEARESVGEVEAEAEAGDEVKPSEDDS